MTQDTSAACPVNSAPATDAAGPAAGCPVSGGGYDALPQPLGPDSLTWKYFGQWTGMLQGPWAGSMQNMHPQLGAAVQQHSIFFLERMPRLFRSVYPIGGVVFDGDRAPTTGAQVRDYHIGIKGVDDQGRRYSALNPDVFYWAHATFFKSTILAAEWLGGGLTLEQQHQLFDEHVQWYSMYGMSMRPVPKSWEDFEEYWDHMCRNVLEDNWATRAVLDLSTMPKHPALRWMPDWLWRLNLAAMQRFFNFTTVGLFDPAVRDRLGYPWSPRQERLHRLFGATIYRVARVLPKRMLMHPRKRSACDRASGRLPVDAPLVETPARNLPPVEYRDDPHFYSPKV
ncbi:oxygenase MpaB family protein [Mycobacterium sp. Y57]|uniref:oxygenase MpaB family protein n=1 Tax=Mycolicibacterium xanthum TaxID=2796469 RepID=UPI001C85FECD|nr:oxygenase MpaB family protein [Mycolicibacterium xanthum]MBX7432343.1 oxygenase MpaB family protein [Mycolicibacterium xanthum]